MDHDLHILGHVHASRFRNVRNGHSTVQKCTKHPAQESVGHLICHSHLVRMWLRHRIRFRRGQFHRPIAIRRFIRGQLGPGLAISVGLFRRYSHYRVRVSLRTLLARRLGHHLGVHDRLHLPRGGALDLGIRRVGECTRLH